ncbi:Uncharacterized conserved protein, DUF2252 family [Pseudomonas oryzae]|uniref:Uncharacterized conserved protein, DUF2252 family n=2 Tax=Pseudomonas oryzae TaxID=1392877 RepID=A0A1H1R4A2_9PSED|nr:Uncharacterized conserved protein, DUF2252 family [Pseudomonas oryzae]
MQGGIMAGKKSSSGKTRKHHADHLSEPVPVFHSREECIAAGRALREKLPRAEHAAWKPPAKGRDPIAILEKSNKDRLQELVPIRYGRMLRSPFTFLRGSAGLMAHDLATTPSTGIYVQACGDCHLLNFGFFATPERNLVFDINDFDESLPAPWEWDVKRLAASFVVAGRDNRQSDGEARDAALECVRAYRENLREYSKMSPLEVWYSRLDMDTLIEMAPDDKARKLRQQLADKAHERVDENIFPKIVTQVAGLHRLQDQPPILFHVHEKDFEERVQSALSDYRLSLPDERRTLLDRYRLHDFAMKVVGIGSVGTRCFVGLFFSAENHPLLLQFKEACPSVLEPYAGKSRYQHQGQRVVNGQRLLQSSSDIFLGWAHGRKGHDFYVRQLRDMKFSLPVEGLTGVQLKRYAEVCGLTLARAHAKAGDAATISGYLGKADNFDEAIGDFAVAYADQTEQDHAALVEAVGSGRLEALVED